VLFFTESPTNPYLRVIDVSETVKLAHAAGVKVVIDSTFASPVNHRALEDGADYVIHSATKYLAGHNDILAGCVIGSAEDIAPVRAAVGVLGGILDPHSAYLFLRGIKTLSLRMQQHNANALRIAGWLEEQSSVRRVWYPGLASHPDHEVAARCMNGFGGVVTFELETDLEGAMRFVDACKIPYLAPSFGGVESLIEMPATMSFWDLPREERVKIGITDSLVRYSCGIEDADDLIADIRQALRAI
jgi:cystathionine gamma-synthase